MVGDSHNTQLVNYKMISLSLKCKVLKKKEKEEIGFSKSCLTLAKEGRNRFIGIIC